MNPPPVVQSEEPAPVSMETENAVQSDNSTSKSQSNEFEPAQPSSAGPTLIVAVLAFLISFGAAYYYLSSDNTTPMRPPLPAPHRPRRPADCSRRNSFAQWIGRAAGEVRRRA